MDQSKALIVYDLASCPENAQIAQIIQFFKDTGFLLYDSQNSNRGARKPEIYNAGDINPDIMVDTSTQESLNILKRIREND